VPEVIKRLGNAEMTATGGRDHRKSLVGKRVKKTRGLGKVRPNQGGRDSRKKPLERNYASTFISGRKRLRHGVNSATRPVSTPGGWKTTVIGGDVGKFAPLGIRPEEVSTRKKKKEGEETRIPYLIDNAPKPT